LEKSKALDRIDHRVKQGMCAAIEVLRGDTTQKPIFESLGFDKPQAEIDSLQVIYQYLASVGLTWTLETISQETNVPRNSNESVQSLIDLLLYPGGKPPQDGEGSADGDVPGENEVDEEEEGEGTELDQEEEDTE
jgi:hypothetical protein